MTPLQQCIVERIQREGPISFADYMHMALYEPGYGYYVTGQAKMGWEGDYYTSTDVADFFANCMGCQLQRMWEKLGKPEPFIVLEQGAGRGDLASGVRAWAAQQTPDLHATLDYRTEDIHMGVDVTSHTPISEYPQIPEHPQIPGRPQIPEHPQIPGRPQMPEHPQIPGRPQGAARTIHALGGIGYGTGGPLRAPWRGVDAAALPDGVDTAASQGRVHVILANELVDAFPVHIVEVRDKHLYELYVDAQEGRLLPVLDEPGSAEVAGYLDKYQIPWATYGDGWRAEINLAALHWLQRAASRLKKGYLLVIDYGDRARALYTPRRIYGTLTCYYRHQANEQPLARPGQQDITAHVNFTALIDEGRRDGLRLNVFTTQRQWLENMGIHRALEQLRATQFAAMDTERSSDKGQIARFHWGNLQQRVAALTDPDGMGNFKVLIMRHP